MANEKVEERNELILGLGMVLQPYQDLADRADPPQAHDYRAACARAKGGYEKWTGPATAFFRLAQDVKMEHELIGCLKTLIRFSSAVSRMAESISSVGAAAVHDQFRTGLDAAKREALRLIECVPVTWEPLIFRANTPFTAYLHLREAIVGVKVRLNYFDRYLKADFFHLFLRSVPRQLEVRLITTAAGVADVLQVSALARQEFTNYQLIQVDPVQMHDRNLRVDDQVFTLGPGVDRAGMALTNFGPAGSSATDHQALDDLMRAGQVIHQS